jgi:hypothetical protein
MQPLLDDPRPKLARLEYGLSSKDRKARWKAWQEEGYDGIEVNILGGAFGPTWPENQRHSLDFLDDFPGIEALNVVVSDVESLEPLASVSDSLAWLAIGGWMEPSKLSCRPIAKCRKLRSLSLGRLPKDLEAIAELTGLEDLAFLGFTFKTLEVLRPLKNLEKLWIGFGSVPAIGPIGELPKLKALEMLRVRKLGDLSPLSSLKTLQFLALGDMKQVESMPDCSRLTSLRRVYLDTMNGVTDLSGLAEAPKLEDLIVVNSKIAPKVFEPIIRCTRPKRVTVGLASLKDTAEVDARLGPRAINIFGEPDKKLVLK